MLTENTATGGRRQGLPRGLRALPEPALAARAALPVLLALAITAGLARAAVDDASPQARAEIETLIEQLGDDRFPVRERAEEALLERAVEAHEALERARQSPDAEVRFRAGRIYDAARQDIERARRLARWKRLRDSGVALIERAHWHRDDLSPLLPPAGCEAGIAVVDGDHRLHLLDPATGQTRWSRKVDPENWDAMGAGEGMVLGASRNRRAVTIKSVTDGRRLGRAEVDARVLHIVPSAEGVLTMDAAGRFTSWQRDGQQRWSVRMPPGLPAGPPRVDAGRVYAASNHGRQVLVIELESGRVLERAEIDAVGLWWGALHGDRWVLGSSDGLVVLDRDGPALRWRFKTDSALDVPGAGSTQGYRRRASAAPAFADDGAMLLLPTGWGLLAIDSDTQRMVWRFVPIALDEDAPEGIDDGEALIERFGDMGEPVVADGRVIVPTREALHAVRVADGTELWRLPTARWGVERALVVGDALIHWGPPSADDDDVDGAGKWWPRIHALDFDMGLDDDDGEADPPTSQLMALPLSVEGEAEAEAPVEAGVER